MADKPMNPFATEDFKNAIKETCEKLKCGTLIREEDFPYINFDDLKPEYCGMMKLDYCKGVGAWQEVMNVLIAHGYEVIARRVGAEQIEIEFTWGDEE